MTQQIKQRIEQIRRGEVPEGYKKTKVGIVPEEWEEKRIGDVLAQRKTLMCVSEDAPLLSFTIEEGVIDPADKKSNKRDFLIKDMSSKKFALTEVGDIIYNPANLKFGAIHRNNLRRGLVSPIYGIFYGEQNSIFMGYLLHNQKFIDYAKTLTEGTVEKLKTLKADTFLKLKITLPSLTEQEKIAEILTTQDKLIELQQKKIDELKRLKKVYLSKMFPKKGCNVPEVRFPGFIDPWEQRKVSDVAEIFAGGTPSTSVNEYWNPKQIPWLSSGEVHKKYITYTDDKISREGLNHSSARIIKENSVLIALAGQGKTRGTVAINRIPLSTNQSIAAMTFTPDICPEFIFFNLEIRYDELRKISSGDGTRGGLNKQLVGDIIIPYTSIQEQQAIGQYFTNIDNLITLHQRKLEEEQKKKKVLMQLLLTGIVRVKI